jgi:hypothetical protein
MASIIKILFDYPILIYIILVLIFAFGLVAYVYLFPFERTITIKEKSEYASGKVIYNTIFDTKGRVYQVANAWPLLHFSSAEVFMRLEKGKKYKVRGYGRRVSFIGLFPNIIGVAEL